MVVYRRASRRRYLLFVLILTGITLITLDSRAGDEGALGAVGRGIHTVVSPVQRGVSAVARPVSDWFGGLGDAGSLRHENDRLREQIKASENQLAEAKALARENQQLHDLMELPLAENAPKAFARVVSQSPGNFEWTIEIDKGEESGISPNMAVLSSGGLVGKVLESWNGGSKVRLLIDPESGVGVRVVQEPVAGIARGRAGSKTLSLDLEADARVAVGDLVETSGLSDVYPAGLLVGQISKVTNVRGFGKMVSIDPAADFDRLQFVVVLKWVKGQPSPVVSSTTTAGVTTTTTNPAAATTSSTLPGG